MFYSDNFRSYRNALRKAVENPPYVPWVFHFLKHIAIPSWSTYVHTWKKIKHRVIDKIAFNEYLHDETVMKTKYKTSTQLKVSNSENSSTATLKNKTSKTPQPLKSKFCEHPTWRSNKNVAPYNNKTQSLGSIVITPEMLKSVKLRKVPKQHKYNDGIKDRKQENVKEIPQRSPRFNELITKFDSGNFSRHSPILCSQKPIYSVKNARSSKTYLDIELHDPPANSGTDFEDIYNRTYNEYLASEWGISTSLNANMTYYESDGFHDAMWKSGYVSQTRPKLHLHKERKPEELSKKKGKKTVSTDI